METTLTPSVAHALAHIERKLAFKMLTHIPYFVVRDLIKLIPKRMVVQMIVPISANIFFEEDAGAARQPISGMHTIGHILDRHILLFQVRPKEFPHFARDLAM